MRSLLVLIIVAACSHPTAVAPTPSHVAPTWKGPEILAAVPADTPYLLGVFESLPPGVRDHVYGQSGVQVREALEKAAAGEGKGAKVAAVLLHHLEGVDNAHWLSAFGLPDDTRFVLYGLSVWPVLRAEIKDATRVQAIVDEIIAASDLAAVAKRPDGKRLVLIPGPKFSFVIAVHDHDVVAALVPGDKLTEVLPLIDGTKLPAHSLRDSPVLPAMLARHHFVPTMLMFVDLARGLDAMTGHGHGEYDDLDTMFDGLIDPVCQADAARIIGVTPRFVLGYRKLDEQGFTATMAVEAPSSLIKALAKLHTTMPAMQIKAQPMFAFGAAVNVDALLAWMKDVTSELRANPFHCDAFQAVNHDVDELATTLDRPIPPMARGLRGFELVIDDATMLPPGGTGHLLVAGDHIADLIHGLLQKLPMTAALQVPATGAPVALPVDQLGVSGIKSAHLALQATKAAIAIGDNSATRASERLTAPDAHAPLMTISYDLPKLRERFGMFLKDTDFQGLSNVGSTALSLDVGDDGIAIEMVGTWAHGR